MDSCWSYCTRLTVMLEFAKRVPARSPPSKLTSTASALTMFSTLSVSALISSREYIMVRSVYQKQVIMKSPSSSRLTPHLLSALRIVAACLFIAHGTQKMFRVPGHPFHAPAVPTTMVGVAGVLETFGGA